jgi:hypothetical protein
MSIFVVSLFEACHSIYTGQSSDIILALICTSFRHQGNIFESNSTSSLKKVNDHPAPVRKRHRPEPRELTRARR